MSDTISLSGSLSGTITRPTNRFIFCDAAGGANKIAFDTSTNNSWWLTRIETTYVWTGIPVEEVALTSGPFELLKGVDQAEAILFDVRNQKSWYLNFSSALKNYRWVPLNFR